MPVQIKCTKPCSTPAKRTEANFVSIRSTPLAPPCSDQASFSISIVSCRPSTVRSRRLPTSILHHRSRLLDKSSRFGQGSWSLNSLHNLYYLRYPIHMNDFLIADTNERTSKCPAAHRPACGIVRVRFLSRRTSLRTVRTIMLS